MSNVHPLPPRPGSPSVAKAPRHLPMHERRLWNKIVNSQRFEDPASIAALEAAMSAHARMRKCREQIDKDGETVRNRFGELRVHPLLTAERDARAAFLGALKTLRLDLVGVEL